MPAQNNIVEIHPFGSPIRWHSRRRKNKTVSHLLTYILIFKMQFAALTTYNLNQTSRAISNSLAALKLLTGNKLYF